MWPQFARTVLRKWPRAEPWALDALDLAYRLALLPFRRPVRRGHAGASAETVARTQLFNQAAEQYFADFPDPQFLLEKPFGNASEAAGHLIDAGVLLRALRLRPADRVLELGAGTCWLSHLLNRCGCRTVAVDVSRTALAMGRTVFERDTRTRWALNPHFIVYDGQRLPLADGVCDAVVIHDAFHHVPNQRQLLMEMYRVLRHEGIVAMSEPGRGHSSASHTIEEASAGVLENELVLEDLAALAQACGFAEVKVVVASPRVHEEIPARDLASFMGGRGFAGYWKTFCSALERHHYIVCYKAASLTTRRPGRLAARLKIARPASPVRVRIGEQIELLIDVTNTGDTLWLSSAAARGWTRLGAHLYAADDPRRIVDFDWFRCSLPTDVPPGGRVSIGALLPPIATPGIYYVACDLVVEGLLWFTDADSPTAMIAVQVE